MKKIYFKPEIDVYDFSGESVLMAGSTDETGVGGGYRPSHQSSDDYRNNLWGD